MIEVSGNLSLLRQMNLNSTTDPEHLCHCFPGLHTVVAEDSTVCCVEGSQLPTIIVEEWQQVIPFLTSFRTPLLRMTDVGSIRCSHVIKMNALPYAIFSDLAWAKIKLVKRILNQAVDVFKGIDISRINGIVLRPSQL